MRIKLTCIQKTTPTLSIMHILRNTASKLNYNFSREYRSNTWHMHSQNFRFHWNLIAQNIIGLRGRVPVVACHSAKLTKCFIQRVNEELGSRNSECLIFSFDCVCLCDSTNVTLISIIYDLVAVPLI